MKEKSLYIRVKIIMKETYPKKKTPKIQLLVSLIKSNLYLKREVNHMANSLVTPTNKIKVGIKANIKIIL